MLVVGSNIVHVVVSTWKLLIPLIESVSCRFDSSMKALAIFHCYVNVYELK